MSAEALAFRPVGPADLALLNRWIAADHVARWWDASEPFAAADLDRPDVAMWLVSADGVPFAYVQDYDVHAEPGHHFGHLPPGSRGIDLFVGPPEMLGRGLGTRLIARHMERLHAAGAPAVAVDPHPDNARAIRVYARLGFRASGPAEETRWGRVLPMVRGATDAVSPSG